MTDLVRSNKAEFLSAPRSGRSRSQKIWTISLLPLSCLISFHSSEGEPSWCAETIFLAAIFSASFSFSRLFLLSRQLWRTQKIVSSWTFVRQILRFNPSGWSLTARTALPWREVRPFATSERDSLAINWILNYLRAPFLGFAPLMPSDLPQFKLCPDQIRGDSALNFRSHISQKHVCFSFRHFNYSLKF